jgi:hypothetical protein
VTAPVAIRSLAVALAPAATGTTAAGAAPGAVRRVPGEVIVGLEASAEPWRLAALERSAGVRLGDRVTAHGARRASVIGGVTVDRALARLAADPAVRWAEPNRVYRARAVPGDGWFGLQWGLLDTGRNALGGAGVPGAESAPRPPGT